MSFGNTTTIQRLCILANVILITLGAYSAVSIFYQAIGTRIQPSRLPAQAAAGNPGTEKPAIQPVSHYSSILDRDLFHIRKKPQTPAAAVNLENLARTQLNLKLWGTVSGDPQRAYAVIEDTIKREQILYRAGDTIQNATVKMILREKVVLSVEGRDEILAMADREDGPPMMAGSRGRPVQGAPPTVPMPSEAEQRITLQRSMLDESFSDVNRLMTEIAIAPNAEEGQPGLSLSRIAPNSIFRRMGLRNGDVLMAINGQQIQTADDAMRMYESLRSSNEIQLQLKRRGQERTINYSIR